MAFSVFSTSFINGLRRSSVKVEKRVADTLRFATRMLHETILSRTPVWSGSAVRNMVWTMGTPNSVEFESLPDGTGTPGTNKMPLGPEPHRKANEQAATQTLRALSFERPFTTYHLTNNASHIAMLEAGKLPTPQTSRAAQGMFFVSFHYVVAMLQSGRA